MSACVSHLRADTVTDINFDSLSVGAGGLDATSYLGSYGITLSSPDGGGLAVDSDQTFYGTPGIVYASSGDNFLQMTGGTSQTVILDFSAPLTSLSFTRIEETGGPGSGNSFGQWSAEVFAGGTEIGSAGAAGYALFGSSQVNGAVTYTFSGSGITSLELDGNDFGYLGTQGILLDDLTLTTPGSSVPDGSSTLTMIGGACAVLAAFRRRFGK
jgi:VPDSG-CTERM motif